MVLTHAVRGILRIDAPTVGTDPRGLCLTGSREGGLKLGKGIEVVASGGAGDDFQWDNFSNAAKSHVFRSEAVDPPARSPRAPGGDAKLESRAGNGPCCLLCSDE